MQANQLGGLVVSDRNLQESNPYISQCLDLNACLASYNTVDTFDHMKNLS